MKALVLLALAALPLSAHEHWREPRRVVVVEAPRCAPQFRWEARHHYDRWEDRRDGRWEHRGWYRWPDRDNRDDRVYLRPLPRPLDPPFGGRVELRFR